MELLQDLVLVKPLENSGSRSSNRFTFQKDWALIKTLELYKSDRDFLIIMDYHDDILVVDNKKTSKMISVYQVKTKRAANWTDKALMKFEQGKEGVINSFLGKLYLHTLRFSRLINDVTFVSNAYFNVKLKEDKDGKSQTFIPLSELDLGKQEIIRNSLSDELGVDVDTNVFDVFYLQVTPLSLLEHKAHAVGKVNDFLQSMNLKISPDLFYKFLHSELEIRNDCEESINTVDELINKKSLSRSNVSRLIEKLTPQPRLDKQWELIEHDLLGKITLIDLKRLQRNWRQCELDKMQHSEVFAQVWSIISNLVEVIGEKCRDYVDLMESVYIEYEKMNLGYSIFDKHYIQAMVLMSFSMM
ncbi:MAG: dsDNA nuclease domain-containing protein [Neobacillus sp.]